MINYPRPDNQPSHCPSILRAYSLALSGTRTRSLCPDKNEFDEESKLSTFPRFLASFHPPLKISSKHDYVNQASLTCYHSFFNIVADTDRSGIDSRYCLRAFDTRLLFFPSYVLSFLHPFSRLSVFFNFH